MKKGLLVLWLVGLLLLSGWDWAEAQDHFYISFSIALGGVTAGAMGFFYFFAAGQEISQGPPPLKAALLNIAPKQITWDVPEITIKATYQPYYGPPGVEGYACLLKYRF